MHTGHRVITHTETEVQRCSALLLLLLLGWFVPQQGLFPLVRGAATETSCVSFVIEQD